MRSPWTQLYLHLAWATWERRLLLTPEIQPEIYRLILAECRKLRVELLAAGGMEDHVHLLVRVPTSLAPATLVKQVKGSTSHAINHGRGATGTFRWQEGYGAFSVSKRSVPVVSSYVLRQEHHHRSGQIYPLFEPPEPG